MKPLVKLVDIVSHTVLILFMVVVIGTAVFSSLLRYYLPMIDEYREVLLEQLNKQNSYVQINAEKIQSEWKPFKPGISLYGVSVKPEGMDQTIDLEKILVEVNVIKSILKQQLYFDYIEIVNLDLLLLQAADGSWNLSGYPQVKEPVRQKSKIKTIIDRLWAIDELALHQVRIAVKPYQKERISLPNLKVSSATSHGTKHIAAELIDGNRRVSRFVLHTSDKPTSEDFEAQAYLKTDNYRILDLLSIFTKTSDIKNGYLSNELWLKWKNQELSAQGRLHINNLEIQTENQQWDIQSITSSVGADYMKERLEVVFPHAELTIADKKLDVSQLLMTYKDIWEVQLSGLDLSAVHKFVNTLPISENIKLVLDDLSPVGSLQNILLEVDKEHNFKLQGNLDNVSVNAWKGAPELRQVNGFIEATKTQGYVLLDSQNLTLGFPKLFNESMLFDKANGKIKWQINIDDFYVGSDKLSLFSEQGKASAAFHLMLPKVRSETEFPRLDLSIGLTGSNLKYRNKFLPYTLDENLIGWIDRNVHDGEVSEAGFIYRGPTVHADAEKKVVQLWLNVRDAQLSYLEDWPDVTKVYGDVLVDDGQVFASVDSAKITEVNLFEASVNLVPDSGQHRVNVSANFDSSATNGLDFLKSKPLSEQMNHVIDTWLATTGKVHGKVTVSSLITKSPESPKVNVNGILQSVGIQIPEQNIEITDISGPFTFSLLKGLQSERMTAKLWGRPLTAEVLSLGKKDESRTSVRVKGNVDAVSLAKWTQQPALNFMTGTTPFSADIYFGKLGAGIKVNSMLNGITVDLPMPFFKSDEEQRMLLVSLPFSGEDRELDIKYGEGVNLKFLMGESGIEAGKINLGIKDTSYQKKKILVGGQLLQADIEEWIDVVSKYEKFQEQYPGEESNEWTLLVDKLQIKTLTGYDQSLEAVSFDLFNTVTYWQLGLDHKDLNASLQIFDDERPMRAHITRVNLEFLSDKQEQSGIGLADPSLSDFPAIDFTIDKLIWQGEDYGEWEFYLRSYDDNIALEDIRSSVKGLRVGPVDDIKSTLMWTLGENPQTHFSARVSGDDLADALAAWGYEQEVHSKAAWFDLESFWHGVPTDWEFDQVNANIRFKLEQGNFADASSSSTDALKFIGLLNVSRLVRRIKLDFSDLTSQGLSFDMVTGNVGLDHGVYTFKTPVHIKGSSSQIRLAGNVDMNTNLLDMRMGVTLPLANNLPWFALIAGLPAAAGIYVISKVMEEQVDKISSVVYSVKGDFDDPQIKFMKLFDTDMKEEDGFFSTKPE